MHFYNSRYNFCFETAGGILFYNSKTGSSVILNGEHAYLLRELLTGPKKIISAASFEEAILDMLVRNGFLLEENRDELDEIRELYWKSRGDTPMVMTLTTTMDCNLGCYYCYESRSKKKLEFSDIEPILDYIDKKIRSTGKKSLHIDWYGGEPLLNMTFLHEASIKIQEYCKKNKIIYHSSIISNGTLWPSDLSGFIRDHKIRQVQISFDGLKDNHNSRRKYRKSYLEESENNSFDKTFELVENLLNYVQVDLRFNIDWKNKDDIFKFLETIIDEKWFQKKFPAVFQPARLASYSEKSSFMEKVQLGQDEYDSIRKKVSQRLLNIGKSEESETPDGFPFPKTYVCAALANDSVVVGADRLLYRCGLQVGETNRAVGSLENNQNKIYTDSDWWSNFDPTVLPSCSKCSFLPVCFSGCPKKHLEKDKRALDEQSLFWQTNLEKKVLQYLGYSPLSNVPLTDLDQFRNGYD